MKTLSNKDIQRAWDAMKNQPYQKPVNIFNKQEWLHHPIIKFTEEEIDAADDKGFIATRYGVDCYLTRPVSYFSGK